MPRRKKEKLIGLGLPANLLKEFIDLSYRGNTSIAPENYEIDTPLSDSRVKVYKKIGSNQVIVVHRGSVGALDWTDNLKFFVAGKVRGTKSFKLHEERQKKAVEKYGKDNNIIGLGHSRAGLYLQELQKDPETKLNEVITYNKAVGFYDALRKNADEQTDVKVKNDFVSLLSGLQRRKNKMVEIDATSNPLDFDKAHQAAEIDKLGDTFIGKKEYEKLEGSGRAPTTKTLEELKKKLKTFENQLININKGKTYKTTNKEKVEYDISYTKARIANYATKGEDLIITKNAKYGNELPAKAVKPKKEEPKPEPKKKEPKKKEPKKEVITEIKQEPKKEEPKKKEPKKEEPKKEEPKKEKPKKEEPKKEEPKKEKPKKEEPKKEEPKKEEKTSPKLAKIEEFITDTENYLNKKSTRAFNAFMKKYDDKTIIKSIIGAQRFSDFYPTSQKCLSNYSAYLEYMDKDDIILEPTAGLGAIVLWLLKNNVKSKIIATDFDPDINKYLKESFDGINQVSILEHSKSDYLDMKNDYYKYNPSVIFLNPPFSNKADKKYYLNFLFKALYDLNESENPIEERNLFFISPQLTKQDKENGQIIEFDEIVMSKNKKEEIKKMLNINNEDEWEDLLPYQVTKVNSCNDFGGTNTTATLYHIVTFGYRKIKGGIFGFSAEEKARKQAYKERKAAYGREHKGNTADYVLSKSVREKFDKEYEAKQRKSVGTIQSAQQGVTEEGEQGIEGGKFTKEGLAQLSKKELHALNKKYSKAFRVQFSKKHKKKGGGIEMFGKMLWSGLSNAPEEIRIQQEAGKVLNGVKVWHLPFWKPADHITEQQAREMVEARAKELGIEALHDKMSREVGFDIRQMDNNKALGLAFSSALDGLSYTPLSLASSVASSVASQALDPNLKPLEEKDETEKEGSGFYYLKEIAEPTNPIFRYKHTYEIPTFIDPETEFLSSLHSV